MPTKYLITGVSRGIGFAFLQKISSDPENLVVGLVRNKAATEERVASELSGRSNVRIVEADLTDYDSVKKAVTEVEGITGGSLDYVIANAGVISDRSAHIPMGVLAREPKELEEDLLECFQANVVGNINLFNVCLPLVLKGTTKKVIVIGTGMADMDMATKYKLTNAGPYSVSKAAMNMAVVKYHAQYADQGVLFMSICPGMVDTGHGEKMTPEEAPYLQEMIRKLTEYEPNMKMYTPAESVDHVSSVIDRATLEDGYGGSWVSHKATKHWL